MAGAVTGTIVRAYTNQDGVTHIQVRVGRDLLSGPLQVRGEPLDNLPGLQVRRIGGGLWVLAKGRAAA